MDFVTFGLSLVSYFLSFCIAKLAGSFLWLHIYHIDIRLVKKINKYIDQNVKLTLDIRV